MIVSAAAGVFFTCIAFVAMESSRAYCARIVPFDDGPPRAKVPVIPLLVGSAVVGVALVTARARPTDITLAAIVVFSLVAAWCSDCRCGIVPDLFTLVPLSVLLLYAASRHDWEVLWSAGLPFAFFAAAAMLTRGRGMGWGDVKLVALAGAALGAPLALLALPVACIAAVVAQRWFRLNSMPMALAPYIAAVTGIALPFGIVR